MTIAVAPIEKAGTVAPIQRRVIEIARATLPG
jgi:hypothetical protein